MMNLCFILYENKFKKKPLPSLSSRKGLTNWRFLLKKINLQNSMFKVVWLIFFALIVQLRISRRIVINAIED